MPNKLTATKEEDKTMGAQGDKTKDGPGGGEGERASKSSKGGGGGNGKKNLEKTKKDNELKALLTLMLKTQLRTEQKLRELEAVSFDTWWGLPTQRS